MFKKLTLFIGLTSLALALSACGSNQTTHSMSNMDHSNAEKPSTASGTAAKGGGTYLDQKLSESVLSAELYDSEGKKFNFESLKGKYLVIANFLTSCQEICPMTSVNIRDIGDAINKAGMSNHMVAMVLSVDPDRDIPSRLKAYKELYESNNWVVASGPKSSIDLIWKFFGAPAKREVFSEADAKQMPVDWQTGKPNTYDMVHADLVIIVDDKGSWRWLNLGSPKMRGKEIPAKMKAFLSSHGLENLVKPEEPTWSIDSVISALNELTGHNIK